MNITTVGLDIAKSVFHLFNITKTDRFISKKQLKRNQLLAYMVKLEPSIIIMQA